MNTFEGLSALASFWGEFNRTALYDTGFSDAASGCGASREPDPSEPIATLVVDAREAMAFLNGYAQACRLACTYMAPEWQIANLLIIAAGTFRVHLEADELTPERVQRLAFTYRAELLDLLRRKAS